MQTDYFATLTNMEKLQIGRDILPSASPFLFMTGRWPGTHFHHTLRSDAEDHKFLEKIWRPAPQKVFNTIRVQQSVRTIVCIVWGHDRSKDNDPLKCILCRHWLDVAYFSWNSKRYGFLLFIFCFISKFIRVRFTGTMTWVIHPKLRAHLLCPVKINELIEKSVHNYLTTNPSAIWSKATTVFLFLWQSWTSPTSQPSLPLTRMFWHWLGHLIPSASVSSPFHKNILKQKVYYEMKLKWNILNSCLRTSISYHF